MERASVPNAEGPVAALNSDPGPPTGLWSVSKVVVPESEVVGRAEELCPCSERPRRPGRVWGGRRQMIR